MADAGGVADLGLRGMLVVYSLLVIPLFVSVHFGLGMVRELVVSVVRMSVQLLLVGLYLGVVFRVNSLWISVLWILVMVTAANLSILGKAKLPKRRYFWVTYAGVGGSALLMTLVLVGVAVRPTPLYDARYVVPITGMVLGNCMRGNVIALERFFSSLNGDRKGYLTRLMLGATTSEALAPYIRSALRAAVSPTLATMATLGLVALPGMMTGQILGGSLPIVAIKYQIAIMICIFCGTTLACAVNLRLTAALALDEYGMPRGE